MTSAGVEPPAACGAHIGGQLNCREAVFANPDGEALKASGVVVGATMSLGNARGTGEVCLAIARIGGLLSCNEAVFANPDGTALIADRITVAESVFLCKAQCTGGSGRTAPALAAA